MEARRFDSIREWYEVTRKWEYEDKVNDTVSITPNRVEACEAPLEWEIRYTAVERNVESGAHIAVEIPVHFLLDHGIPYPVGRNTLVHKEEGHAGFNAPVDVRVSDNDAEVLFSVSSTHRFNVVDIVIVRGMLKTGGSLSVILGDINASRVKAPKFSQRFLFACGVDYDGNGKYRGIRDVPYVDVTGAAAQSFRIIAPATVKKGEEFDVTLYPADRYSQNPAAGYSGKVRLKTVGGCMDMPESIALTASDCGIAAVKGCVMNSEGLTCIIAADEKKGIFGVSNPVSSGFSQDNIFFGEIHGQGYDSIGVGTLDEYFTWGRDVERLDFCATAYHYNGRYDITPGLWNKVVESSNRYYRSGKYVTFVSFEWGSRGNGHKNVYYKGSEGDFYWALDDRYDTPSKLWGELEGREAITITHHPKFCGRAVWGSDYNDMDRLVEIYSAWGISEEGGPHCVRAGLLSGHRLGFTGGTDTHKAQPAHGTHEFNDGAGVTAVYAEKLTRECIFEALQKRRCYATTGARILLDFECSGLKMGEETAIRENDNCSRKIRVKAAGACDIKYIDIIRNGDLVYTYSPEGSYADFEWEDKSGIEGLLLDTKNPDNKKILFYYCRVVQKDRHIAWASPIWFLE